MMPKSGSAAQIFYRQYSEPDITMWMLKNLKEGDAFIDIGSHVGEYALIASSVIGDSGKILAIEPQADLCDVISYNFNSNKIINSKVIRAAVGPNDGFCHLHADQRTKGAFLTEGESGERIQMISLSTAIKDVPSNGCIWMKLDAAGHEFAALEPAWDFISSNRVNLFLKAYHNEEIIRRFPQYNGNLYQRLMECGYDCSIFVDGVLKKWNGNVRGYCEMVICEAKGGAK